MMHSISMKQICLIEGDLVLQSVTLYDVTAIDNIAFAHKFLRQIGADKTTDSKNKNLFHKKLFYNSFLQIFCKVHLHLFTSSLYGHLSHISFNHNFY